METILTFFLSMFIFSATVSNQETIFVPPGPDQVMSEVEQGGLTSDGEIVERSFVHNDSLRSYLLYVPAAYDGSEAWPLVINYHGFSSSPAAQMYISQMNLVADTAHFLIAYPQGLHVDNPFAGFSAPGWNADGTLSNNDDVDFSSQLIDQIGADYTIDPARVYATGVSMGGSMSFQLGCHLADRIAAIASVANQMAKIQIQGCSAGRPLSVLLMHGTEDPNVPFNGDGIIFPSATATPYFWAGQNNCSPDSLVTDLDDVVTSDTSTVTLVEYIDCEENTEVLFYRINGGGHTWPGGGAVPAFFGKVNRDINASSEIWNFFNRNPHPAPARAQLLEKKVNVDGTERDYLLYVPAAYDGSEAWPLVLNFHGYNSSPMEQIFFTHMNEVADTAHFLVAYPAALPVDVSSLGNLNPLLPTQGVGWNIFGALSENDDLAFVNKLIDQVGAEYRVQAERVYSTGFSFGGIMSQYLASVLNDRIAAIASVSGSFLEDEGFVYDPGRPFPILHMHGTGDNIVPYDGTYVGASADSTIQFWVVNNGCIADSVVTMFEDVDMDDGSTVTRVVYSSCSEDSEVWFYSIEGGGHTWPGGPPVPPGAEIFGNTNMDIDASSEIWNFFNRHMHPGVSSSAEDVAESMFEKVKVYPNPSRGEITIDLDLKQSGMVQMRLFTVLGQPVGGIVNQHFPSGQQQYVWNRGTNDLPPGTYFIQIRFGSELWSQPILINPN